MGVLDRFRLIDAVLNVFLLTPLIVLFVLATFTLHDKLCSPAPILLTWIGLFVSVGLETAAGYFQKRIIAYCHRENNINNNNKDKDDNNDEDNNEPAPYRPYLIAYNYFVAVVNICHMRAVTLLLAYHVGDDAYTSFKAAVTTAVLLLATDSVRNLLCAPLSISLDTDVREIGHVASIHDNEADESTESLLDHLLTHAGVHSLVHLHWAAVWALFDCSPLKTFIDTAFTWGIGVVASFVFLYYQTQAQKRCRDLKAKKQDLFASFFENLWCLTANVGTIMLWRSIWMFFDGLGYYFPIYHKGRDVTAFYSHVIAFGLLASIRCSSNCGGLGCEVGSGVSFQTNFLVDFFHQEIDRLSEREKKNEEIDKEEEKDDQLANGIASLKRWSGMAHEKED